MPNRPTLYILDAYSLIFQVFHAIPAMTGPAGQPTNAVFGIFRDLLNLLRDRKPDYLAAAFDGADRVFRSDLYEDYKAHRAPMPDDLRPQIDTIRRLFDAFRIPVLLVEGYEADDVIATLAQRAVGDGLDVVIVTADKDARQLIGPHCTLLNLRKNQILDQPALLADWGILPHQVPDLLALTGDSVDNIPGVPGIGPKTAAQLLQQFGSLDQILAHADQLPGKKAQALRDHADSARLGRSLVTLKSDVPLDISWDQLRVDGIDADALKSLCHECGFHRFLHEIDQLAPTARAESEWNTDAYSIIDSPEALHAFLDQLRAQTRFALDTETTSLDPLRADLVGLSFCWTPGQAFYLPVKAPPGSPTLHLPSLLESLRPILTDPNRTIVGQNLKYDLLVLGRHNLPLQAALTDTMILSYLLESGERNHNLDDLARRLLDHSMIPISDLIGRGKSQQTLDQIPVPRVAAYAGEDADAAWRIAQILQPRVEAQGLWTLYTDVERPLIAVLASMEAHGIKIDIPRLQALSAEFALRLQSIQDQIHALAGRPFNIASPHQLRTILFDQLKLPARKKTPKGEPSTDADVLDELANLHPLPRLIVQYRQLDKLKSTYLDTLPRLAHPDGRIHASFNQAVAATGRLSSSDPNLQNIPTRTDDGRQIRQAFVASFPDWSLLAADYSQIELRILAHFSQDPALLQAFSEGKDIHSVVASQIFQIPESQVSPDQRRIAKTVNFGVIYGLSPYGLASRLGITQADATAFIDAYFQQYSGVAQFIDSTRLYAQTHGHVATILGRRRAISGIKATTGRNLNLAERTAINTVIQGSAADLIKVAMIRLDSALRSAGLQARILLQIHDELVLEAPNAELHDLAAIVHHHMTTALPLTVPIDVNLAAGPNWLDLTDLPHPPIN
ncbi:MAG: DNA polymerase I [Isosphaeraceae bacterium]|jgi:DNA polymerase-1|nr:MAG: DNA polymerase I [Isosphaeraceae bacterium]